MDKLARHVSKEEPKIENSSINTSIKLLIQSENMAIIHLWNMEGALHNLKGILR